MRKVYKKAIALVATFALVLLSAPLALPNYVSAANIPATAISFTPANPAVSTQVTEIVFTPTTALVDGDTITVYYDTNMVDTGLVLGDITAANTGGTLAASAVDTAGDNFTIGVTTAGTGGSQVTITLANSHFATPASVLNLEFGIVTNDDVGADVMPMTDGTLNDNQVLVSGSVAPKIGHSVRATSNTHTTFTNECAFGALSEGTTNNCQFYYEIHGNTGGGLVASWQADDDFNTAGGDAISNVDDATGDLSVTTTEAYGVDAIDLTGTPGRNVSTGVFDQSLTAGSDAGFDYTSLDAPIPTAAAQELLSYADAVQFRYDSEVNAQADATLITLGAVITSATPAGNYTQVIDLNLAGTF